MVLEAPDVYALVPSKDIYWALTKCWYYSRCKGEIQTNEWLISCLRAAHYLSKQSLSLWCWNIGALFPCSVSWKASKQSVTAFGNSALLGCLLFDCKKETAGRKQDKALFSEAGLSRSPHRTNNYITALKMPRPYLPCIYFPFQWRFCSTQELGAKAEHQKGW